MSLSRKLASRLLSAARQVVPCLLSPSHMTSDMNKIVHNNFHEKTLSLISRRLCSTVVQSQNCITRSRKSFLNGKNLSLFPQFSEMYSKSPKDSNGGLQGHVSALQAKKRNLRKKKKAKEDSDEEWQVTAYATAHEYDLEGLLNGLTKQGLYIQASKQDSLNVIHMMATYKVSSENREIYFFEEGAVVFWNVPELERLNVIRFMKNFESLPYVPETIEEESESLTYTYTDSPTRLVNNLIMLNTDGQTELEKYTVSNALGMSVKLGIWEASLDEYVDKIESVTQELRKTGKVLLTQEQVLQKMGELFALRHLINLSSDFLDIPDFYWEHEELEQLYHKIASYLSIAKRTSVMNTKLGHCVELMELLKSHLNDKHAARLEVIIIVLIMVEVIFECLHFIV